MRRLTVTTLGAMIAVLAMAGAANALSITVNWIGTSGTGATGGNKISVGSSPETLTAEVKVNYGGTGIKAVSVSFEWDTALVFKGVERSRPLLGIQACAPARGAGGHGGRGASGSSGHVAADEVVVDEQTAEVAPLFARPQDPTEI